MSTEQIFFFRLLPPDSLRTAQDLKDTLEIILKTHSRMKIVKGPDTHPRGGFSIWILAVEEELEACLDDIISHGIKVVF